MASAIVLGKMSPPDTLFSEEPAREGDADSIPSTHLEIPHMQIDFKALFAKADAGTFTDTDKAIREHAVRVLAAVQELDSEITIRVGLYNEGETNLKASIVEKINKITKDLIHKKNFPRIFEKSQLDALEGFFKPIDKACSDLKAALSQKSLEKLLLQTEKELRFSTLLCNEQQALSIDSPIFANFLERLNTEISNNNFQPMVYFAYAWPTEERKIQEFWVQGFLKNLHAQLQASGIHETQLDIVSNRLGNSIYEYMRKAESSDCVILFGTESFKEQHEEGLSVVYTKVIHNLRKRRKDAQNEKTGPRVFPVILSGTFPPEYEWYSTASDWPRQGYLDNFQRLYLELFNFPPEWYLESVKRFWNDSLEAFPKEKAQLEAMILWYQRRRDEVALSTTLDELNQIPLSPQEVREVTSKVSSAFNNTSLPPKDFTGREKELAILNTLCAKNNRVAIHGLGGVGKTILSLKYANEKTASYRWIHSVNGTTSATISKGLLVLANELKIPQGQPLERLGWLKRKLDRLEELYLLIFDGVDHLEAYGFLESLLPNRGKCLLITTRTPEVARALDFQLMPLTSLDPDDAITYLLQTAGDTNREQATLLAGKLGCLPLALSHASSFIRESNLTFEGYLKEYEAYSLELFKDQYLDLIQDKETVLTIWSISLETIVNHHQCPLAKELLGFLALLDHAPIPRNLVGQWFKKAFPEERGLEMTRALKLLIRYSLIERLSPDLFGIHQLVQDVTRYKLEPAKKEELLNQSLQVLIEMTRGVDLELLEGRRRIYPLVPHMTQVANHAIAIKASHLKELVCAVKIILELFR